jgi:hypothetical protein
MGKFPLTLLGLIWLVIAVPCIRYLLFRYNR